MAITIHDDLTATIVNDLGTCKLPSHNPTTLVPWTSESEVEAFATSIQNDKRYFQQAKPNKTVLTPIEFKMQFSAAERVAIRAAKELGDPILVDFFDLVDDPRLKEVILTLPDNIAAINYLVSLGLLTEARATEILAGIAPK